MSDDRVTWGGGAYAGFWQRFAGYLIDTLLLYAAAFIVIFITTVALLGVGGDPGAEDRLFGVVLGSVYFAIFLPGYFLYDTLMTSKLGWTLGKRIAQVEVRTPDGALASWGRIVGRYFARILSSLPLLLGYLWAAWDPQKQTWHDKIAGTYVLKRNELHRMTVSYGHPGVQPWETSAAPGWATGSPQQPQQQGSGGTAWQSQPQSAPAQPQTPASQPAPASGGWTTSPAAGAVSAAGGAAAWSGGQPSEGPASAQDWSPGDPSPEGSAGAGDWSSGGQPSEGPASAQDWSSGDPSTEAPAQPLAGDRPPFTQLPDEPSAHATEGSEPQRPWGEPLAGQEPSTGEASADGEPPTGERSAGGEPATGQESSGYEGAPPPEPSAQQEPPASEEPVADQPPTGQPAPPAGQEPVAQQPPAAQPAPPVSDLNLIVVEQSALAPESSAWLRQVAEQVDPRLDRISSTWRSSPQAATARACAFGLLLGYLALRYSHMEGDLGTVAETHPSFSTLLAGSRLETLKQIAQDPGRTAAWLGPLIGVEDAERVSLLFR